MKRWSVISVMVVVAIWLVVDTIGEFFANDTIQYFASKPDRLLYVAAIGVAGGLAALVIDRLSPRAQRRLKVFSWGAGASLLTVLWCFWCYMLYQIASLSSLIKTNAGAELMVLALLVSAALAAYLWLEFYRAWKTWVSQ